MPTIVLYIITALNLLIIVWYLCLRAPKKTFTKVVISNPFFREGDVIKFPNGKRHTVIHVEQGNNQATITIAPYKAKWYAVIFRLIKNAFNYG